jgi:hypothetical protein
LCQFTVQNSRVTLAFQSGQSVLRPVPDPLRFTAQPEGDADFLVAGSEIAVTHRGLPLN